MKHFYNNIQSLEKRLSDSLETQKLIESLPYKVGEPVIYKSRVALVYGFEITYDKLNSKKLEVLLTSVTDESGNHEGLWYKTITMKASTDDVAPYTDAAKLLFSKG